MVRAGDPSGLGRESSRCWRSSRALRQICCDPRLCIEGYQDGSAKLETCLELVSQAVDAGHKVLVFCSSRACDLLAARLSEAPLFQLTGQTSKEARERLVPPLPGGGRPTSSW